MKLLIFYLVIKKKFTSFCITPRLFLMKNVDVGSYRKSLIMADETDQTANFIFAYNKVVKVREDKFV